MHFLALLAVALPTLAAATPTVASRWSHGDDDTMVLNFQLLLEQLENAFYDQGLRKFDQNSFHHAGFPDFARGRFNEIQKHECEHAAFLSEAIRESGADTVSQCKYRFPLDSPEDFARTSLDISTIVGAAYTGALGHLDNHEYRIANGMMSSAEGRRAGWVNSALFKENPWNTAFDTCLTLRQAWTAISRYIESCPRKNEDLVPRQSTNAFPRLEIVGHLVLGQRGQVRFRGVEDCERRGLFVVIKTGMQEVRATLQRDGFFVVPQGVANSGANFIFVTSNDKTVTDENIVAGPTIYQFDFNSEACVSGGGEFVYKNADVHEEGRR